ncbi:MAG: hypothetical protein EPN72_00450 [Nevskiaceae bacterium]|nr:MAG: hypothetical protein EPN63_09755 [Nevskiaceae bacterium]TBR75135.1 MAG: hypothetical protein EPN72_00450 [Nevskiaceae bacterium]
MEDDNAPGVAEVSRIELQEMNDTESGPQVVGRKLDLIKDVQITADVLLGRVMLTVGRLLKLQEKEILELDTELTAPVTIRLDGKPIGNGEIVAVGDRFGVLITRLADA